MADVTIHDLSKQLIRWW